MNFARPDREGESRTEEGSFQALLFSGVRAKTKPLREGSVCPSVAV